MEWYIDICVKVTAHVRRIEAVEKELKALADGSATKEDIHRVRAEVKKLYDGLHVGTLVKRMSFYCYSIADDILQSFWTYGHMYGGCVSFSSFF